MLQAIPGDLPGTGGFSNFMTDMKRVKLALAAALTLVLANPFEAQAQYKYSNEFLAIGVGARALGMSNAAVASTSDVTSGYWNPAGLLGVRSNMQVGLMHAEYFASIAKYDFGGIAMPIDSVSAFGVNIIRFAVDDIPNTTQLIDDGGNIDYDRITTFSAQDWAFLFSYARKLNILGGLETGGNFKIIRRKVGDFGGAWGFGLDASANYRYKNWRFAGVLRDVTSTFNAWSFTLDEATQNVFVQTGNAIPENGLELTMPRLLLGGAREWELGKSKKFSLLAELDLINTFDGKRNTIVKTGLWSMEPALGLEAGFRKIIFLRAGIGNMQKSKDLVDGKEFTSVQPNIGLGLKLKQLHIDYALTDIGDASVALYSNIFSLKLDINKTPK